jgi:acyl-CoA thioester hydrolase
MPALDLVIRPRFNDTDALGHINNASVATWFEEARLPIFRVFVPDLDIKKWNLIVARIQIDYRAQLHYQFDVQLKTQVLKLGTSSFTLTQSVHQNGTLAAEGTTTLVHFNYQEQRAVALSQSQRNTLSQWLAAP